MTENTDTTLDDTGRAHHLYTFARCGFFSDGSPAYRAFIRNNDGTVSPFATLTADQCTALVDAHAKADAALSQNGGRA
jgi:hypothetical protein